MELNVEKFQLIQNGKISHLEPSTSEIYTKPPKVPALALLTLSLLAKAETVSLKARQFA